MTRLGGSVARATTYGGGCADPAPRRLRGRPSGLKGR
jgi:hypothetical protein